MKNKFIFKSFIKEVEKDLKKAERKKLRAAGEILKKRVRTRIKITGLKKTGNLLKGVSSDLYQHRVLVGMRPPAFHALIVELGHEQILTKKQQGPIKEGKKTKVKGKPYFLPAFRDKEEAIKSKIREYWL